MDAHDDRGAAAVFLERLRCERRKRLNAPSDSLPMRAVGIAGNPLPQLVIVLPPGPSASAASHSVHGTGVVARAMEGKFAAFAARGEGAAISRHLGCPAGGVRSDQHVGGKRRTTAPPLQRSGVFSQADQKQAQGGRQGAVPCRRN